MGFECDLDGGVGVVVGVGSGFEGFRVDVWMVG